MIIAKPVIDKQFWILQKDNRKIGNVEACAGGYQVSINNHVIQYKTMHQVQKNIPMQFEPCVKKKVTASTQMVHGFPTKTKPHNAVWDVTHKLPLFTKARKSKSWFAAGWYKISQHRNWRVMQDPKLITLQRYPYQGPYTSESDAAL